MQTFDYIIVGAGSSGCVLANRLTVNPAISVLLIEAGPADKSWLVTMPRGIGKLLTPGDPHIWTYEATRRGNQVGETWMKGKMLGGSSSVNGMLYVRGHPSDYDRWEAAGCKGWGWRDIEPIYDAMESRFDERTGQRTGSGPLKVTLRTESRNPLSEAFIASAEAIGIPRVTNNNDAPPVGAVGYQPATIWRGRRQSAAKAFLEPVRNRPNLHILTDTLAVRVEFAGTRATGVWLEGPQGRYLVGAGREIILAAGAVETPKLLQLSGVGAAAHLRGLDIPIVADRPAVGENLREHVIIPNIYQVTEGSLNRDFSGARLFTNVLQYLLRRAGPMASAVADVVAYARTREGLARPDVQIGLGLQSLLPSDQGVGVMPEPGVSLISYLMHPQSQGRVWITSTEPVVSPTIDPNYLDHEVDRTTAVAVMKLTRRLMSQTPLQPFIRAELIPGTEVGDDDHEMLDFARAVGSTGYHVSCTCRMGADENSVVDPELRVRGVAGLRIADTSVMPDLPSGNTNGPAMAIGWRAAEIIRDSAKV